MLTQIVVIILIIFDIYIFHTLDKHELTLVALLRIHKGELNVEEVEEDEPSGNNHI